MAKEPSKDRMVETATFKYVKAPEYRVIAANGVYGGPQPRGEIKLDFFIEFLETPSIERFAVKDNRIGESIERIPGEGSWVRELQIGVMLSRSTAKSFAKWLLQKVNMAEEQALKEGQKLKHKGGKE